MPKTLGKDIKDAVQRKRYLEDNADGVEKKGYMKPYTPAELQGHKEALANLDIEIHQVEDEKRASMEYFKDRLKPLQEKKQEVLHNIMRKAEYVTEECYKFVDRDSRMTEFYNAEGDIIESRPATADELSPNIFSMNRDQREGTNN